MINKILVIIIILLLILVIPAWIGCQCSRIPKGGTAAISHTTVPPATEPDTTDTPVIANTPDTPAAPLPKPALNLELPKEDLLMNSIAEVPEKESWLKDLFKSREKEKSVKVGGSLILDEKPADPNAAVWDQVKGAEVGVTIKTP